MNPEITYSPIGYFSTPHKTISGMPIQPKGAAGISGSIRIRMDLVPALADLEGFSHVFVLYHFHKVTSYDLTVTPFLDTSSHGLFATRTPKRPNSIGLSVMELVRIEENIIHLNNVDVLDETPVLDIKPYVPDFDVWPAPRTGWLQNREGAADHHKSDKRFE